MVFGLRRNAKSLLADVVEYWVEARRACVRSHHVRRRHSILGQGSPVVLDHLEELLVRPVSVSKLEGIGTDGKKTTIIITPQANRAFKAR